MLTLAGIMSSQVMAAVTINSPEEIVLIAINDQEVNAGLFRSEKNTFKVDPGNTTLSVRYQQFFQHISGEHDIAKSGIVTIPATNLIDGQNYKLVVVDQPKNYDDAVKYAEQPTIALYDAKNQLVVQQTGANNQAKPWFKSGVFARTTDYTSSAKPAAQPAPVYANSASAASQTTQGLAVVAAASAVGSSKDQQMIQLWQSMSKAERQKFMNWLAEQ